MNSFYNCTTYMFTIEYCKLVCKRQTVKMIYMYKIFLKLTEYSAIVRLKHPTIRLSCASKIDIPSFNSCRKLF